MADSLVFTLLGIDRLSDKFDQSAKSADNMADRIDRVGRVGTASLLGLPAVGGLAGAGVAAGLASIPIALGVVAAVSQSTNTDMMEHWSSTGSQIAAGMRDVTGPLADDLVEVADRVGAGFAAIGPDIRAMSEAAGPGLLMLTDGAVGLATTAVPGMRRAVEESTPVMAGLNTMLWRTGEGASTLFDELSRGAPSAGRNVGELGNVTSDLLGTSGQLLTMLSDDFASVFPQVSTVLDQTTDAAVGLGEGGFPAVAGGASTLLGIAGDVLDVLGPIAPQIGTITGVMLAASVGSKVFGAVGDVVAGVGDRATQLGDKSGRAGGAVRGLGNALSGIGMYGALAGAAILGTSAAMDAVYGSADDLASQLMLGGDAAAAATAKLKDNEATLQTLSNWTSGAGQSLAEHFIPGMRAANEAVGEQRQRMSALQLAQADVTKAQNDYLATVEQYGSKSAQGAAASAVLTQAQQRLRDMQYDTAQATKSVIDRLSEQQALSLGLATDNLTLRMATTSYEQAQQSLTETLKTHTLTSLEGRSASQQVESQAVRLIEAAKQEALAHYANQSSVEAQTAAAHAANAKLIELAGSMQGPVPEALKTMIAGLDNSALAALGVTRTVNAAGEAVYALPPGAEVTLTADDRASAVINDVRSNAENLNNNWYEIFIKGTFINDAPVLGDLSGLNLIDGERAAGGRVLAGDTYLVGEEGPELLTLDGASGMVQDHRTTKRMLEGRGGMWGTRPMGGGGFVGAGWAGPAIGSVGTTFAPVVHVYESRNAAATAEAIVVALRRYKRELGGAPLGIS